MKKIFEINEEKQQMQMFTVKLNSWWLNKFNTVSVYQTNLNDCTVEHFISTYPFRMVCIYTFI